MTDTPFRPGESPLESWKAIAAYLSRDVRTAKRWEESEGLPIHRHKHHSRSSVYAYPSEIDAWRQDRKPDSRSATPPSHARRARLLAVAAVLAASVVTAGGGRVSGSPGERQDTPEARVVWGSVEGVGVGNVSADGRYLPYSDPATGRLMLRDLAASSSRPLTHQEVGQGHAEFSAISRQGDRIAYLWWTGETYQLRVLTVAQPTMEPRVVFPSLDARDIAYLRPHDWSPDGVQLAVAVERKDRTGEIALVSTADGSYRRLTSTDWRGSSRLFFSPDGTWLLFDTPAGDAVGQRDVFAIATDGGRLTPIATDDADELSAGWSPDGDALFTSNRRGTARDLFGQSMRGVTRPQPTLLRANVEGESLGVDAAGRFLHAQVISNTDLFTVDLDPSQLRLTTEPVRVPTSYWGSNDNPQWSPDGARLAYLSRRAEGRTLVLVVRSSAYATTHEIPLEFRYFQQYRWAPDGKAIIGSATGLRGERTVVSIGIPDGTVTNLIDAGSAGTSCCSFPQLSADGGTLYYRAFITDQRLYRFMARELASGREREVFRSPAGSDVSMRAPAVSPDGKAVATIEANEIWVVSLADGSIRKALTRADGVRLMNYLSWTPDSQFIVASRAAQEPAMWLIPANGDQPRVMKGVPFRAPAIHPGGRRIAYVQGQRQTDIWALERLWPASVTR